MSRKEFIERLLQLATERVEYYQKKGTLKPIEMMSYETSIKIIQATCKKKKTIIKPY